MKKLIALMTTAVLATGMFTSCSKKYHYDDDKAISLATEYMKEKYGKEIKDISTHHVGMNEHYIGVEFKLNEFGNEEPDEKTYEVRVYIEDDGKTHYVKCDNYMRKLFNPYLKEKLSGLLEENGIEDYYLEIITADQYETGTFNYFMKDFEFCEGKTLDALFKANHFCLKYSIYFPEKSFYSSYLDEIKSIYAPLFDNDYVRIKILVLNNNDYEEITNSNYNSSKNLDGLAIEEIIFN